jgi:hypothetical protein
MKTFNQYFKIAQVRVCIIIILCFVVLLIKTGTSQSGDLGLTWNSDIILTEPIVNCSIWQTDILSEYEKSKDEDVRARDAFILSSLWKEDLLKSEIKDYLVDKYYRLALIQSYGNYSVPNWQVQSQQSFPFPSVWVGFTPTLYKNGEVSWSPDQPQKEHAMSLNSSIVTSQTGGVFQDGDAIYYTIKIEQKKDNEVVWEKTIKTNQVVLGKLRKLSGYQSTPDSREDSSKF